MNFSKFDFFPLQDKLNFSKGTYYVWMFSLGRQTEFFNGYTFEFFLLEDKLNFSMGKPLNFFPWKTN